MFFNEHRDSTFIKLCNIFKIIKKKIYKHQEFLVRTNNKSPWDAQTQLTPKQFLHKKIRYFKKNDSGRQWSQYGK